MKKELMLIRVCPACEETFLCKGECGSQYRLRDQSFCYCSRCYVKKLWPMAKKRNEIRYEIDRLKCPMVSRRIKGKIALELLVKKVRVIRKRIKMLVKCDICGDLLDLPEGIKPDVCAICGRVVCEECARYICQRKGMPIQEVYVLGRPNTTFQVPINSLYKEEATICKKCANVFKMSMYVWANSKSNNE